MSAVGEPQELNMVAGHLSIAIQVHPHEGVRGQDSRPPKCREHARAVGEHLTLKCFAHFELTIHKLRIQQRAVNTRLPGISLRLCRDKTSNREHRMDEFQALLSEEYSGWLGLLGRRAAAVRRVWVHAAEPGLLRVQLHTAIAHLTG